MCFQGESTDNFNWGVRRRPLLDGETERDPVSSALEESVSEDTPVLGKKKVSHRQVPAWFLFFLLQLEHYQLFNSCLKYFREVASLKSRQTTKLARNLRLTKFQQQQITEQASLISSILLRLSIWVTDEDLLLDLTHRMYCLIVNQFLDVKLMVFFY